MKLGLVTISLLSFPPLLIKSVNPFISSPPYLFPFFFSNLLSFFFFFCRLVYLDFFAQSKRSFFFSSNVNYPLRSSAVHYSRFLTLISFYLPLFFVGFVSLLSNVILFFVVGFPLCRHRRHHSSHR